MRRAPRHPACCQQHAWHRRRHPHCVNAARAAPRGAGRLGLGILTAITDALDLIERDLGARPNLDALPEETPEVWRAIGAADTIGVFQIESRAQQQSLPRTKPVKMDDLVAQVAIIRPGPIQGNAVHPYLRRRAGLEAVAYPHQSLAPILVETLGVILYQEQVMRIAIEVAGFTPGASDVFRRAMGSARSEREMALLQTRFVDGAIATASPVTDGGLTVGAKTWP